MTDAAIVTTVIVVGLGVLAIVMVVKLKGSLTGLKLNLRKGQLHATADPTAKPLRNGGVQMDDVVAGGDVTADDETGEGARLARIKAGGSVRAKVREHAPSKKK